jgi:hypothetical protein
MTSAEMLQSLFHAVNDAAPFCEAYWLVFPDYTPYEPDLYVTATR